MFTGIVEGLGRVEAVRSVGAGRRLVVRVPLELATDVAIGDSLAVNGVCLTAVVAAAERLEFDLAAQTLRVTTLDGLAPGDPVNLERPLRLGARLGGHLVLGHVDGVGRVTAVTPEAAGRRLTVEVPAPLRSLLIPKGSVAVDGVSLTVADLGEATFTVALIPHTLQVTTLGGRGVGAPVNLEMDVIGKYVRALLTVPEEAREIWERYGVMTPGAGGAR